MEAKCIDSELSVDIDQQDLTQHFLVQLVIAFIPKIEDIERKLKLIPKCEVLKLINACKHHHKNFNFFHFAFLQQREDLLDKLSEYNVDCFVDLINSGNLVDGNTPVHLAVASGNARLIKLAEKLGGDFSVLNHNYQNALDIAYWYGCPSIIKVTSDVFYKCGEDAYFEQTNNLFATPEFQVLTYNLKYDQKKILIDKLLTAFTDLYVKLEALSKKFKDNLKKDEPKNIFSYQSVNCILEQIKKFLRANNISHHGKKFADFFEIIKIPTLVENIEPICREAKDILNEIVKNFTVQYNLLKTAQHILVTEKDFFLALVNRKLLNNFFVQMLKLKFMFELKNCSTQEQQSYFKNTCCFEVDKFFSVLVDHIINKGKSGTIAKQSVYAWVKGVIDRSKTDKAIFSIYTPQVQNNPYTAQYKDLRLLMNGVGCIYFLYAGKQGNYSFSHTFFNQLRTEAIEPVTDILSEEIFTLLEKSNVEAINITPVLRLYHDTLKDAALSNIQNKEYKELGRDFKYEMVKISLLGNIKLEKTLPDSHYFIYLQDNYPKLKNNFAVTYVLFMQYRKYISSYIEKQEYSKINTVLLHLAKLNGEYVEISGFTTLQKQLKEALASADNKIVARIISRIEVELEYTKDFNFDNCSWPDSWILRREANKSCSYLPSMPLNKSEPIQDIVTKDTSDNPYESLELKFRVKV